MSHSRRGDSASSSMPWGLTVVLLSVVSAVAVGVPFLSQPMLEFMRADYDASLSEVGVVATSAQIGAAMGILLLVPLADLVRPHIHLSLQLGVCALSLAVAAWSPNLVSLSVAIGVGALCSVVAQIILPIALRESPRKRKARTAATLGASLLFGIFGSRLIAGVLGAQIGWRATLVVYSGILLIAALCAWIALRSTTAPASEMTYRRLLVSLPRIAFGDATLVLSSMAQGFTFAAFNAQWAVIASHLMQMTNPWTAAQAGLVNIVGLGAGVLAVSAGPLVARIGPSRTAHRALPLLIVMALIIAFWDSHLLVALIALLVLSTANQVGHVANQTEALFHHHTSVGRANSVYMFGTMLGGAAGAAIGTLIFPTAGLSGVSLFSAISGFLALVCVLLRDFFKRR